MKLHTVFITYNRLELTKITIQSYLETVSVPFTLSVVDNDSQDGTAEWILFDLTELLGERAVGQRSHLLSENRYPGYATNLGWEEAPQDATHLHRSDNDFRYLPGWCEEVERLFSENRKLGQVGLRTDEEECYEPGNTGGNCVIPKQLFDDGLRYDETPWPEIRRRHGDGYSEDSFFSALIRSKGYRWMRVQRPCIQNLATGDWGDSYYQESYGIRGIRPREDDPTVPEGFVPYDE